MANNTKLTVAKICHELANYLSIIQFMKEDIATNTEEIQELIKIIDTLTYTMDFFRNIYSDNTDSNAIIDDINRICNIKGIKIVFAENLTETIPDNIKNSIFGIVYQIIKVSKKDDVIKISGTNDKIFIKIPEYRAFPTGVANALLYENVTDDIFNVFINYVKNIAIADGYNIVLDDYNQQVVLNRV